MKRLARWFPQTRNYRLWGDLLQFHQVIRKGCWPLSPFSLWFLFHLTAAGKHLQQRSAIALLGDALQRQAQMRAREGGRWALAPVDLWSEDLQQELINAEEGLQQDSIALSLASVMARHGDNLADELVRILRATVLAAQMGLKADSKSDAIAALAELARLPVDSAETAARQLQEEFNVLEWDEGFNAFDILGDAVPRTQFLAYVRRNVAAAYDERKKAQLFASRAGDLCDLLGDLDTDFAEMNKISTREWRYASVRSTFDLLPQQIKLAVDRWLDAAGVDEPRGTVIYCYVEPSRVLAEAMSETSKMLRHTARDLAVPVPVLPIRRVPGTQHAGIYPRNTRRSTKTRRFVFLRALRG